MAELLEYRERFPILAETTYLINHSLGAMPAAVEERVLEFANAWNSRGVRAWEEGDVAAIRAMLAADATFAMPPIPLWYRGPDAIAALAAEVGPD